MSSSNPQKPKRKSKKNASNPNTIPSPNPNTIPLPNPNTTPSPQFYVPSFDTPIYSPASMWHPTLFTYTPPNNPSPQQQFQQFPPPNIPTHNIFQTQTDTQTEPQTQFDLFETVPETQFTSNYVFTPTPTADPTPEPEPVADPKGKGKAKCVPWTRVEEKALAEAWLDVSEDPVTGDNQDGKTFKLRVWRSFCNRMGKETRTCEQCYAKWRTANKWAMEFNGLYANIARRPPSGTNESHWIASAHTLYANKFGKAFAHEEFWEVVRNKPKWKSLKSADDFTGARSKRSKTSDSTYSLSSDGRTQIDLNVAEDYESPPQYVGRDTSK